jgi:hypothetical protein
MSIASRLRRVEWPFSRYVGREGEVLTLLRCVARKASLDRMRGIGNILVGLVPGPHKVLVELADSTHKVITSETVQFVVPDRMLPVRTSNEFTAWPQEAVADFVCALTEIIGSKSPLIPPKRTSDHNCSDTQAQNGFNNRT